MASTESSSDSQHLQLPPGFRFHPTDEELVVHYLKKKAAAAPLPVTIIADVDLYKFDPWELPGKATFGEQEWYFFSPRDRKYPNGARPNRAATSGYWKATGTDKPILASGGTQKIGVKKALVFYGGKPPKGTKTNWIMHEYRLVDNNISSKPPCINPTNKKSSLRLDEWVLCRIYKKNNSQRPLMERDKDDSMDDMLTSVPASRVTGYGAAIGNDENFFEGLLGNEGLNSSSKPELSMLQAPTVNNNSLKRTLPPLYWSESGSAGTSSSKRFQFSQNNGGGSGGDGNNSIVALLNQLPQTPPFHQHALLGSLNEGILRQAYQLSGMNWDT